MGGVERVHDLEEGVEIRARPLDGQRPGVEQSEIRGDPGDYPRMGFVNGVRQSHDALFLLIVRNILNAQNIRDIPMDRTTGIFVDGIGTGAAPSGVLTQLQGRIFALLYLQPSPLSLEQIAAELQQSKSNISTTMRGLVEWQLVRRVAVPGSRKDHYEAATDFWRVMQEIFERRFRWMVRQVVATVDETRRVAMGQEKRPKADAVFVDARLDAMRAFFATLDVGISAFAQGESITGRSFQKVHAPPRPPTAN
jgi:DNA-binding transcriptional regulator GbsR (MarR family)